MSSFTRLNRRYPGRPIRLCFGRPLILCLPETLRALGQTQKIVRHISVRLGLDVLVTEATNRDDLLFCAPELPPAGEGAALDLRTAIEDKSPVEIRLIPRRLVTLRDS